MHYVVTWQIDIEDTAKNPTQAAVQALLVLVDGDLTLFDALTSDPNAAVVFDVEDADGNVVRVDLGDPDLLALEEN